MWYSIGMNEIDRKILIFLSTRETVAIESVARVGEIPLDKVEQHLRPESYLRTKDLVLYLEPIGTQTFLRITDKGRAALWGYNKRILNFFVENWLTIIATIAALIAAVTGIISLMKNL